MIGLMARLIGSVLFISNLSLLWLDNVLAAAVRTSNRVVDAVTIREQPTTQSPIVGRLSRGKEVEYLGELPNWYFVRTDALETGYVHKSWTRYVDEAGRESVATGPDGPFAANQPRLELHFVDVGQGDSTLLVCPNGNVILVDSGSSANGSVETVRSYLLRWLDRHEHTLNALVVTHPDRDHYNFLVDVLDGITVQYVVRTGNEEDIKDDRFRAWLRAFSKRKQRILYPKDFDPPNRPNTKLACGEAKIHVLAASIPTTRRNQEHFVKNSLSSVLMVRYGTFTAILTGDATFDTEDAIMERYPSEWLHSTVLKLGHHGSRTTSTSDKWVATVKPEVAIASAGFHSAHGHPSEDIVLRLEPFTTGHAEHTLTYARGRKPYKWQEKDGYKEAIFNTADNGNIVVSTNGEKYVINFDPGE
jgi:beta-lactamase superfamily II metal-dependent hydrolase